MKFYAAVIALLIITLNSFSQNFWSEDRLMNSPSNFPFEILFQDINNNGEPEIFLFGEHNLQYYNYLSEDSSFMNPVFVSDFQRNCLSSELVDLNSDSFTDIVTLIKEETYLYEILWYEFDEIEDKFLTEEPIYSTNNALRGVLCFDYDNDSDQDIIISSVYPNRLSILHNDSELNPSWNETIIDSVSVGYYELYKCDINGDGFKDILGAGSEPGYYLNQGDGTFSSQIPLTTEISSAYKYSFYDIDNDGDLDIINSYNYNNITWLENIDGAGNFSLLHVIEDTYGCNVHTIFDVDGDSDLDICTVNDLQILINNGNGIFDSVTSIDETVEHSRFINNFDINNDGIQEIFVNNSVADRILVYFKQNDTSNYQQSTYPLMHDKYWTIMGQAGDYNGDQQIDVVYATPDGFVTCYNNNNCTSFHAIPHIDDDISYVDQMKNFDIDGDNDLDIILKTTYDNIKFYKNSGGQFDEGHIIDNEYLGNPTDFTLADMDNDGDLDFLSIWGDNTLYLQWNLDGAGSFGQAQEIASYIQSTILTADMDNDSDLDIIYFTTTGVRIFFNNGDGEFESISSSEYICGLTDSNQAFMIDLDNDSDLDIVIRGYNNIFILENTDTYFTLKDTKTVPEINFVDIADIDMDGDIDFAYCTDDHFLGWVENIGGNNPLGDAYIIDSLMEIATSVQIIDVNNDDVNDIIATTALEGKVTWYQNMTINTNLITTNIQSCPGTNQIKLSIESLNSTNFQWQIKENLTYEDLSESDFAIGTNTRELILNLDSCPISDIFEIRCKLNNDYDSCYYESFEISSNEQLIQCHNLDTILHIENCQSIIPDFTQHFSPLATCTDQVSIQQIPEAGTLSYQDTVSVTVQITDNDLNTISCSMNIQIIDTIPPTISSIPDTTIFASDTSCITILQDYTTIISFDDNCPDQITLSQYPVSGTEISESQNIELTATDINGNSVSTSFYLSFVDETTPLITCAGDSIITLGENDEYYIIGDVFNPLETYDNCSYTYTNNYNNTNTLEGEMLIPGNYEITWDINDINGNSNECSLTIEVLEESSIESHNINIQLFPNPTDAKFQIINQGNFKPIKLKLYNIDGQCIFSKKIDGSSTIIDIEQVPTGIYYLELIDIKDLKISKTLVKK